MFKFLVECTQNYSDYTDAELISLLKSTRSCYDVCKIRNTSLYLVTCEIETIENVINRSIFVKQVSFYGFCCIFDLKNVLCKKKLSSYNKYVERNALKVHNNAKDDTKDNSKNHTLDLEINFIEVLDVLNNCLSDDGNCHCCNALEDDKDESNINDLLFGGEYLQNYIETLNRSDLTAKIVVTTIKSCKGKDEESINKKEIKKNAKKAHRNSCKHIIEQQSLQVNKAKSPKYDSFVGLLTYDRVEKDMTGYICRIVNDEKAFKGKTSNILHRQEMSSKIVTDENASEAEGGGCNTVSSDIMSRNMKSNNAACFDKSTQKPTQSIRIPSKLYDKQIVIEGYKKFLNNVKIDLKNPMICLNLIHSTNIYKTIVYKSSNRKEFLKYDIPCRPFIGITAMDWEISIFMCNLLYITKGQLVLDPFVGSGGLLMAASMFDAYVFGIEYDIKMLVGFNDRNGNVRTSLKGYNIIDNFRFMNKENKVLGFVNGSMFDYKIEKCFDFVITDPPYGDRISLNKNDSEYFVKELKFICDKALKNEGKVCFWSVCGNEEIIFNEYKLEYKKKQVLGTVTRTLFMFTKY